MTVKNILKNVYNKPILKSYKMSNVMRNEMFHFFDKLPKNIDTKKTVKPIKKLK